ncbi:MAG: phospholipid carrier-dependent glycosyltransferase, partial [Bacteroidetes bacterium]|nr:phospholipid carrier-dependent glycosyltransferase [Bacteroidota bacterium]
FKREILSDVPFSFFMLLGVLLFRSERKNILHFILTGLIWGFALSVRGIGATLFLASGFIFFHSIFRYVMKKEDRSQLLASVKKSSIVVSSAILFYLLMNAVLFPIPSSGILKFYADAVSGENFAKWLLLNLDYYYYVFLNFFATMGGSWLWLCTFSKFILLSLIPIGIVMTWYRRKGFDDWLFIAYLLVLFIYPYLGGGFRFLLPVMPLILKYIYTGFSSLISLSKVRSSLPGISFFLIILFQYTPGIIGQVNSMDYSEEGPQEEPAVEAFEYISHLPDEAVVVFLKPRALSFYSGKRAAYVTRNVKPDEIRDLFKRMNAHYFLLCSQNEEVNDVILKKFIVDHKSELKLIWHNNNFELYYDLN